MHFDQAWMEHPRVEVLMIREGDRSAVVILAGSGRKTKDVEIFYLSLQLYLLNNNNNKK